MDLIVVGYVKHNGQWFNPGDSIKEVKQEDTDRLITLGVAKVDEVSVRLKEESRKKAEEEAAKFAVEKAKEKKAKQEAEKKKQDEKDKKETNE